MPSPTHVLFQHLADQLPVGISIFKLISREEMDFEYVYANQALDKIHGVAQQPLIGMNTRSLYAPAYEGAATFPSVMMKALDTQKEVPMGIQTFVDERYGPRVVEVSCFYSGENHVAFLTKASEEVESLNQELSIQKQMLEHGEKAGKLCTWIVNQHTGEKTFTQSFLDIHDFQQEGITPQNATAKKMARIHPKDRARVGTFKTAPHETFPVSESYRYLTNEGKYIWLEDTLSQRLPNGSLIGITKDVTEHKEKTFLQRELHQQTAANEELTNYSTLLKEQSEELEKALRFQHKIMETSPEIIYVYDLQAHQNAFANKSLYGELGYEEAEIQAMRDQFLSQTIHPEDLEEVFLHHTEVLPYLQAGDQVSILYRIQHNETKEYVWLESHESAFEFDEEGKVKTIVGIARNVTQQKQAEFVLQTLNEELATTTEELRVSNEELLSYSTSLKEKSEELERALRFQEKIMETSPDIIYIYDVEMQENFFTNGTIFNQMGYSTEEMLAFGDQILKIVAHPEDLPLIIQHYQEKVRSLQEGDTISLLARYQHKDGRTLWFESTESIFETNEKGEVNKIIGLSRNVTAQKQADIKLQTINQELEEFIYSISHDLRAPVRHIEGYAERIHASEAAQLSEKGQNQLERVISSAQRLGTMIDELLAYSRTRNARPNKIHLDVQAMVSSILKEFRLSHPQQDIQWEIGHLPSVLADPTMMQKVWENLISNAIKYSSKKEQSNIRIEAKQEKGEVIFSIHDNGAGFNQKYADKLFSVFQRLHTRREFPGNGIGLANVARIVQRHGGRIWGEGVVGEGASFYFTIPMDDRNG